MRARRGTKSGRQSLFLNFLPINWLAPVPRPSRTSFSFNSVIVFMSVVAAGEDEAWREVMVAGSMGGELVFCVPAGKA